MRLATDVSATAGYQLDPGLEGAAALKGSKVLVTGAGGFIGRALATRLVELGAFVTAFGRGSETAEPGELIWIGGEFTDPLALERCCEGQDYVFHLLSSSTPESATRQPVGDVTGNVVPCLRLIEAAATVGVKRFVFFSSGGTVYGRAESVPVQETNQCMPLSAYGISKLSIEHYLRVLGDIHGMEYRILRLSNPYGPGQSPFKKQGLIAAALYAKFAGRLFDLWGDGSIVRDFIHIDDVVTAAILLSVERGDDRIYNVGSGFGRSVASVLGDIDALAINPELAIRRHPVRKIDVPTSVLDISRLRSLGWEPVVNWDDGLVTTGEWVRREYKL